MAITGLDVFDSTVHQTNAWLKFLMSRVGLSDRHQAYIALKVTLQVLRDRLTPELAVHLGAQLPMLVRGFYYQDWRMSRTPTKERHVEKFVEHVGAAFCNDPEIEPEAVVRAVFQLLAGELDPGEIHKVVGALPRELRQLWPEEARG
jgi:uncharacterized protein (DUF2267 family)